MCAASDADEVAGIAVGAAIGGLVFLGILSFLCKKCTSRTKQQPAGVPAPQPAYPQQVVHVAQQPQMVQMAAPVQPQQVQMAQVVAVHPQQQQQQQVVVAQQQPPQYTM